MPRVTTRELLDLRTKDAWQQYLYATRDICGPRYFEVEGWAWARLTTQLRVIERDRSRLAAA